MCVYLSLSHEGNSTHHNPINVFIFFLKATHVAHTPLTVTHVSAHWKAQKRKRRAYPWEQASTHLTRLEYNTGKHCTHIYMHDDTHFCFQSVVLTRHPMHTHILYITPKSSHTNSWKWIMNPYPQLYPLLQHTMSLCSNPPSPPIHNSANFSPVLYHLLLTSSLHSGSHFSIPPPHLPPPPPILHLPRVSELGLTHAVWLWILQLHFLNSAFSVFLKLGGATCVCVCVERISVWFLAGVYLNLHL